MDCGLLGVVLLVVHECNVVVVVFEIALQSYELGAGVGFATKQHFSPPRLG
jgi:hypothetical protein